MSAHSYAEAYSTVTRSGERAPFGFTAGEAWAALASLRRTTGLIGLTSGVTFEAIGLYAALGGTGPRLNNALIGGAAVAHGIRGIVTGDTGASGNESGSAGRKGMAGSCLSALGKRTRQSGPLGKDSGS